MMSPNVDEVDEKGHLQEHAYVVTAKEISAVTMTAKLVILSSCWSSLDTHYVDIGFTLPSAFLAAGLKHLTRYCFVCQIVRSRFERHSMFANRRTSMFAPNVYSLCFYTIIIYISSCCST